MIKAVIDLASIDFETRVLDSGFFLFNGHVFFSFLSWLIKRHQLVFLSLGLIWHDQTDSISLCTYPYCCWEFLWVFSLNILGGFFFSGKKQVILHWSFALEEFWNEFDEIICHFVLAIYFSTWKFHIIFWGFIWSICIWL